MRSEILQAIERTAILCAYADGCESGECPRCEAVDESADVSKEGRTVVRDLWRNGDTCRNCGAVFAMAGGGEDWDDMVPDDHSDPKAKAWAERVAVDFVKRNGVDLETMANNWTEASGEDVDRFGHCVAMEYLGHGVGLGDDVPHGTEYTRPDTGWISFDWFELDFAPLTD